MKGLALLQLLAGVALTSLVYALTTWVAQGFKAQPAQTKATLGRR